MGVGRVQTRIELASDFYFTGSHQDQLYQYSRYHQKLICLAPENADEARSIMLSMIGDWISCQVSSHGVFQILKGQLSLNRCRFLVPQGLQKLKIVDVETLPQTMFDQVLVYDRNKFILAIGGRQSTSPLNVVMAFSMELQSWTLDMP